MLRANPATVSPLDSTASPGITRAHGEQARAPHLVRELRLWFKSPAFAAAWPADGLCLPRLPFVIGRLPATADDPSSRHVDLRLPDAPPFQLSRVHFCILRYDDRLAVMDTNSQLGTVVNGVGIGRGGPLNHAFLADGLNYLTIGTSSTRFVFELLVK
jgi:FHA domain